MVGAAGGGPGAAWLPGCLAAWLPWPLRHPREPTAPPSRRRRRRPCAAQDTARHIAEVVKECRLEVNEQEYVEGFKPVLMDVVFAWSKWGAGCCWGCWCC